MPPVSAPSASARAARLPGGRPERPTPVGRLVAASVVVLLALGGSALAAAPAQADSGDGTVVTWYGTEAAPDSLAGKDVIAISAFDGHQLALTSDGRVTAWGDNSSGQTDVPASLQDRTVTSVAAGCGFSLALTSDGAVTAWGANDSGQATVPGSLAGKTVTAISAGCGHSLALTSDGQVVAWGANESGQTAVPASLAGKTVTVIDAAFSHSLAVTSDGRVTAWGRNDHGQTDVPASLADKTVTDVAGGLWHSVALTSDGELVAWGDNSRHQIEVPPVGDQVVVDLEASVWHSLALTSEGNVLAWGHNGQCQLCVPALPAGTGYTAIAVGHLHSVAVRAPLPIDFTTGTTATIAGTPQVGQTLTADSGDVTPTATSLTYRWFSDGAAIAGATGPELTLTSAQQDSTITVQVTARKHGYNDSTDTSAATSRVVGTKVVGTTTVGRTLRGDASAVTAYDGTPLAKQWLRNGSPVADATDATYVLTNADAGATIAFQVTGTKDDVTETPVTSAEVGPVSGGVITLPAPVISGTPAVDSPLSAALPDGHLDPADAAVTWQWLRDGSRVGTGSTYTPRPSDAGAALTVRATATKDYFNRVSESTDSGTVVPGTFGTLPVATISGTVKVGEVLTADAGPVAPGPDGVAYQWYADQNAIEGATHRTLTLTPAQRHAAITVEVTAARDGYDDVSDVSDPTAEVATELAPELQLDEGDSNLRRGQSTTLTWSSTDADTVTASGDWTGSKVMSGSASVSPTRLGTNTYVLRASNDNGSTTTQVAVTLNRQAKAVVVAAPGGLRAAGSGVPVTGKGLDAGERYTIRVGNSEVAAGTASGTGSLSRTVTIPSRTKDGTATVTVTGSEADRTGRAAVRVIARKTLGMRLAHRKVRVRHRQTVAVSGLAGGERLTVRYNGRRVSPRGAHATASGTYRMTFRVGTWRGPKHVVVTGQRPDRTAKAGFWIRRR